MNHVRLLIKVYKEMLHELLNTYIDLFQASLPTLLRDEISKLGKKLDSNQYLTIKDECTKFFHVRLESYDPSGYQHTLNDLKSPDYYQLRRQSDWYNDQVEFDHFVDAINDKVKEEMSEEETRQAADELLREVGAFPDNSIISGYESEPKLNRLPDYVVARIIEEMIRQ